MAELVAVALPAGPGFIETLQRAWDAGDAVLPIDPRLPPAGRQRLIDDMAPSAVIGADGERIRRAGGRDVEAGDALVIATSGTTGGPRGVVLTHAAVRASAVATSDRLGVTERDHWLACLPLAHVGGLSVVTRALATGTPLTVLPRFDVEAVHDAARAGATLVSLVATALARIDASLFRTVVLGGSRPPENVPTNVVTTYGLTETGSGVVYDGQPLEGVELRIDGDGGIHVRGPMLLRAYRDGRDPKDADGWLATGDIGRLDARGRLTVDGRADDLIITGGENVWPEIVEAVLSTASGVGDVAVAGRLDPEWGMRVVAFVVPADRSDPPALEPLRAHVKEHLPAFAAPREVVIVERVPRTALGKVRRAQLR